MRILTAIAFASCLFAAACSQSSPQVEVPLYRGEPNGDDAAMIGRLVMANDCLFVQLGTGEHVLTAFPAEFTEWDGQLQILTLSGDEIPLGEVFVFGGSGMDTNRANAVTWAAPPDEACLKGQRYIWLSQQDAIPISERPDWFRPGGSSQNTPPLFPPTPTIANP